MLNYEQYCQRLVELAKLAGDALRSGDEEYAFFVIAELFQIIARDGPDANRGAPRGGPRYQITEEDEQTMAAVIRALCDRGLLDPEEFLRRR